MGLHRQVPRTRNHLMKTLEGIPFFNVFEPEEKKEFASSDNYMIECDDGTSIVEQGDIDFSLYILMSGEVILTRREAPEVTITTLKPGAVFGEISLIHRNPRPTNVIAKGKVKLFRLDGEVFNKLSLPVQMKFKDQFIGVLIKRVEEVNNTLLNLKSELDRVSSASNKFRADYHNILKSGARLEGVFENMGEMIDKLVR